MLKRFKIASSQYLNTNRNSFNGKIWDRFKLKQNQQSHSRRKWHSVFSHESETRFLQIAHKIKSSAHIRALYIFIWAFHANRSTNLKCHTMRFAFLLTPMDCVLTTMNHMRQLLSYLFRCNWFSEVSHYQPGRLMCFFALVIVTANRMNHHIVIV